MATAGNRPQRSARQRAAIRLLAAGAGIVAGLGALSLVWPLQDHSAKEDGPPSAEALAEQPSQALNVLLIGSDADRQGAISNGAAPAGPANSDALLLVHVDPNGPVQVMNLPIEGAVRLPGDATPVPLGSLYRRGGAALVASASAELLGLADGAPERYVVIPRTALRELVDGMGRLELAPDRAMAYTDQSQKLTIALQGGLQQLNGTQVEQYLRFRDPINGEERRRDRQEQAIATLLRQMGQAAQLKRLPSLIAELRPQVDTNLSPQEVLSLMAVALQPGQSVQFQSLSLRPALNAKASMRELEEQRLQPRWP
ncbi:MAG: LCP family protein [Vulcanococcus sp.]|jgi:LCP family protein required for cell wall assembly|uniref:LCP family protein n=1 Tax=unclassified Vulcanococcus TaxID=2766969 RepID=UPI0025EF3EAE|nr:MULTISPECIES: LCP family protein [unclassified Vulcanococcus]NCV92594.1 LytR family transcriptional regulator [Synechococcaceae bacterium WB7_3xG_012]